MVDREEGQGTAADVGDTAQAGYRWSTGSEEWHRNVRKGNAVNALKFRAQSPCCRIDWRPDVWRSGILLRHAAAKREL